ncbi:MAG: alpha/beta hydrolase [Sulfurovum sp.]|nr:alpha/beta hydrolase [Sulfurovum sp.]
MKIIFIALVALLALYLAVGLLLYIKQRSMLYFPTSSVEHPFETMTVENEGEKINVIITNTGQKKALIYFGGNAEAVASGATVFAKELPDYTTYLVEYRGYGKSTGKTNEAGLFSDAIAIYEKIKPTHSSISIFGRSLGTGIASYIASLKKVDKLVLITPYDSIEQVAKDTYPIFPISLLLTDKYNSIDRVPKIKAKTIILIAQNDTIVPKKYAYSLAKKFPEHQVEVHEIKGSHHNDIADTNEYSQILKRFFYGR